MVDLVRELHQRSVPFKRLADVAQTKPTSGRFVFHVMASPAEMGRKPAAMPARAELEISRQWAALVAASAK
ncbi:MULTISPECIES: hypothetical protein [Pandoraea]|uniref:Uncharacterized protein n=1 Tax=Pandoraea apista TaxID=93218 RepID=A0ABX9ZLA9_9BURK|nr:MULTISPECIES: hypothetical protein [Pandoraea]MBN9094663.1 hypothetical protein [Pandoraea pnomenusa]RRJ28845.1 hypothetical protein EIB05_17965 [Pandoraea apista]RRJ73773.1 hypothetical protein EIL82_18995 [Pandoraea apista]RSD07625.1 hypothetical protein EJB12_17635 [Pandoraea apista]RSD12447.1 hypothetical protein EIZ52_20165 [Pandoraea apista]